MSTGLKDKQHDAMNDIFADHRCDGLSVRRMAVLWTCREPSLGRHVRRELLRNVLSDFTPIIPATACHQRNYFETDSRCTRPRGMHPRGLAPLSGGQCAFW